MSSLQFSSQLIPCSLLYPILRRARIVCRILSLLVLSDLNGVALLSRIGDPVEQSLKNKERIK